MLRGESAGQRIPLRKRGDLMVCRCGRGVRGIRVHPLARMENPSLLRFLVGDPRVVVSNSMGSPAPSISAT